MTNYYWIIAQHSGKVLEVKDGSLCSYVEIIQHKGVDMQLWYFNGGFIVNKRSCFVLDAAGWKCQNGTKIIQYQKQNEPALVKNGNTAIRTILSI
ncbi:16449_t:CDS:2 [Rhizophagus irregularis]|nr:16449_t:CDS:2 [Rhizophagus irregularis]